MLRFEPTPPEIRDKMREIFERAEFQREKGIIERIFDWIGKHLFPDSSSPGGSAAWGGSIGSVIAWLVIVLLVIVVLVLIGLAIANRSPRVKKQRAEKAEVVDVDEERSAAEWASDAEACERDGRWKDAIRARYRELVERLVAIGVVDSLAGRTTGELRHDVRERVPAVGDRFSAATLLFELPWYADVPTGPEENAEFKRLAASVLQDAA